MSVPRTRQIRIGDVFARWTVNGDRTIRGHGRHVQSAYPCRCACGTEKIIYAYHLYTGASSSCGCLAKDVNSHLHRRHGERRTSLYGVWCGMKQRCLNPLSTKYADYGGRGITVCIEWQGDYHVFRDWARSHGYAHGLQIDRIDNAGNYCAENCRFVPPAINRRNSRSAHLVTAFGETRNLMDWVADPRCTVSDAGVRRRLRAGWSPERAIMQPKQIWR